MSYTYSNILYSSSGTSYGFRFSGTSYKIQSDIDEITIRNDSIDLLKIEDNLSTFNTSVKILGDFYISGTTTTIYTENMNIKDNIILLNSGETSSGVTLQYSGIEIDRGTSDNYKFVFDENSEIFRIGQSGATTTLQAVATRDDIMYNIGVSYWDESNYKFLTNENFTWDSTNGFFKAIENTTISNSYTPTGCIIATNSQIISNNTVTIGDNINHIANNSYKLAIGRNHTNVRGIWVGDTLSTTSNSDSIYFGKNISNYGSCVGVGHSIVLGYYDVSIGIDNTHGINSSSANHRISLGTNNTVNRSRYSILLGFNNESETPSNTYNSINIGSYTKVTNQYCSMFGFGVFGVSAITNTIYNSLAFGSNSDIPTLWITGGDGTTNSQGKMGLRTSTIDATLHIKGESTGGTTDIFRADNSSSIEQFSISDNGLVNSKNINNSGNITGDTVYFNNVYINDLSGQTSNLIIDSNGLVSTGSSNILGGVISETQIAFGDSNDEITGVSYFTYNTSTTEIKTNTKSNVYINTSIIATGNNTNNIGIGYKTINANTTGDHNIAMDTYSLRHNTTGTHNVGIGYNSIYTNSTGSHNIGIGHSALYWIDGDKNIGIGDSGPEGTTTISNKLYIDIKKSGITSFIYGEMDDSRNNGRLNINSILKIRSRISYPTTPSPEEGDIVRLKDHTSISDGYYVYNGSNWISIIQW